MRSLLTCGNMKKSRNRHLLEFRAILCSVMAEYSSDITDTARKLPRERNTKDTTAYQSYSDEVIDDKIGLYREKIYSVLTSEEFIRSYPKMGKVDDLPYTALEKCIIFMIGIGLEPNETARMLLSDKRTVMTIKSKRKKDILKIFLE